MPEPDKIKRLTPIWLRLSYKRKRRHPNNSKNFSSMLFYAKPTLDQSPVFVENCEKECKEDSKQIRGNDLLQIKRQEACWDSKYLMKLGLPSK